MSAVRDERRGGVGNEDAGRLTTFPDGLRYYVNDDACTVRTVFPDDVVLVGHASFTDEDVARARALGYTGDDHDAAWAMHSEHDLLHHVIARAEGWPYSMVLRQVALGLPMPSGFGNREERLAFLLARALNVGRDALT